MVVGICCCHWFQSERCVPCYLSSRLDRQTNRSDRCVGEYLCIQLSHLALSLSLYVAVCACVRVLGSVWTIPSSCLSRSHQVSVIFSHTVCNLKFIYFLYAYVFVSISCFCVSTLGESLKSGTFGSRVRISSFSHSILNVLVNKIELGASKAFRSD